MPTRRGCPDVPYNPEIERSCRRRNAIKKAKRRQRLQEKRLVQAEESSNTQAEHAVLNPAVFPYPTTDPVHEVSHPAIEEVPEVPLMAAARPWMDTEA
ncbi:hypothetical protein M5689_003276 [Euphorbia peplus]|nr:hypothetical protein M5689_003276 [Euphorbia peplus]